MCLALVISPKDLPPSWDSLTTHGPGSQCGGACKSMHLIKRLPHWPWGEFQDSCEIENKTHPSEVLFLPGCLGLMSASQAGPFLIVCWELSVKFSGANTLYVLPHTFRTGSFSSFNSETLLIASVTAFLLVFTRLPTTSWGNPSKMEANCIFFKPTKGRKIPIFEICCYGWGRGGSVPHKEIICLKMEGAHFST